MEKINPIISQQPSNETKTTANSIIIVRLYWHLIHFIEYFVNVYLLGALLGWMIYECYLGTYCNDNNFNITLKDYPKWSKHDLTNWCTANDIRTISLDYLIRLFLVSLCIVFVLKNGTNGFSIVANRGYFVLGIITYIPIKLVRIPYDLFCCCCCCSCCKRSNTHK